MFICVHPWLRLEFFTVSHGRGSDSRRSWKFEDDGAALEGGRYFLTVEVAGLSSTTSPYLIVDLPS